VYKTPSLYTFDDHTAVKMKSSELYGIDWQKFAEVSKDLLRPFSGKTLYALLTTDRG
jgi:hypothetical protein